MSRLRGIAQGAILLLAAWYLVAALVGLPIVPTPHAVASRLPDLFRQGLLIHAAASLARALAALGLAFLVALPLGVLLGSVRAADLALTPAVLLLYPVPKIALLPVVLVLFGLTNTAKVLMVFLVLVFQMLVAIRDAIRAVEPRHLLSARSLGARGPEIFRYVLWPSLLPRLLAVLRIGSGTALAVLFFAETFATRWGLGYLIMDRWMRVAYADMYAAIISLALLGLGIFAALDLAERLLCPWQRDREPPPIPPRSSPGRSR